jgi:hypothetical protein
VINFEKIKLIAVFKDIKVRQSGFSKAAAAIRASLVK